MQNSTIDLTAIAEQVLAQQNATAKPRKTRKTKAVTVTPVEVGYLPGTLVQVTPKTKPAYMRVMPFDEETGKVFPVGTTAFGLASDKEGIRPHDYIVALNSNGEAYWQYIKPAA